MRRKATPSLSVRRAMPAGQIRRRWATAARRQHRRLPPSAPSAAQPPSKPRLRWFEHGERNTVLGLWSLKHSKRRRHVAVGYAATASGDYAIAFGRQSQATMQNTLAIGDSSKAIGMNSTALGSNAPADDSGSIAVGSSAQAHLGGTAVGQRHTLMGTMVRPSGKRRQPRAREVRPTASQVLRAPRPHRHLAGTPAPTPRTQPLLASIQMFQQRRSRASRSARVRKQLHPRR